MHIGTASHTKQNKQNNTEGRIKNLKNQQTQQQQKGVHNRRHPWFDVPLVVY